MKTENLRETNQHGVQLKHPKFYSETAGFHSFRVSLFNQVNLLLNSGNFIHVDVKLWNDFKLKRNSSQ